MSVDSTSRSRLNEVLAFWDAGTPRSFRTPDTGTINQTRIVDTDTDRYVDRRELPPAELDLCAEAYAVLRGHSLWLFEELYGQGNERVRRFLNPGPFVPVEEQWSPVRATLR